MSLLKIILAVVVINVILLLALSFAVFMAVRKINQVIDERLQPLLDTLGPFSYSGSSSSSSSSGLPFDISQVI